MAKSQTILGIILMIVGVLLLLIPVVGWIYGPILFLIGLALIIFKNSESKIEQIKTKSKTDSKSKSKKGGKK